jgi:hypothetical protein
MNVSLLCKWWWILETQQGLWQEIVRAKYVKGVPICLIKNRVSDSPVWKDMMKVHHIYLKGREYKINNGKAVSFWLDAWLGADPLCKQYPVLYDLCEDQRCSVSEVAEGGWLIQFKIRIPPLVRERWYDLAARLNNVNVNDINDTTMWKWYASRQFTVKYVYQRWRRRAPGGDNVLCRASSQLL